MELSPLDLACIRNRAGLPPLVFAATGHRPDKLGGYNADVHQRLVALAWTYLGKARPDQVISGMALGWDQAWAEAATHHNIPFIAAVPFEGQEMRWPRSSQVAYTALLAQAAEVQFIDPDVRGAEEAIRAMQRRNRWMVDRCSQLVALWNGTSGGTSNCIRYATTKGRFIVNLWDYWQAGEW